MVSIGENVGAVFVGDGTDEDGFHAAVAAEAHVAGAVADHHRAGKVDVRIVGFGLHCQSSCGLSARAAASGQVGTHIYIVNVQTVCFQNLKQVMVYLVHRFLRADAFGDALLVGDNENSSEILDNERDGVQEILPKFQLGDVFHVVVDPQNVDHPVAVQK